MKIKLINFGYKNAPRRAHYNDAGADVYLMNDVTLFAHETKRIPLGFGVEIPDGFAGYIFPRGSVSAKGVTTELPPIDSGYRGEIHAVATNNKSVPVKLHAGDRIGQLVVVPVVLAEYVEELDNSRGTGAFGSTGK